jgi:hypothetical protein
MKKAPLSATNPYLKNIKQRHAQIRAHVISSSAIEGVRITNLDKNNIKFPIQKAVKFY